MCSLLGFMLFICLSFLLFFNFNYQMCALVLSDWDHPCWYIRIQLKIQLACLILFSLQFHYHFTYMCFVVAFFFGYEVVVKKYLRNISGWTFTTSDMWEDFFFAKGKWRKWESSLRSCDKLLRSLLSKLTLSHVGRLDLAYKSQMNILLLTWLEYFWSAG